jgi:hypothetical protein
MTIRDMIYDTEGDMCLKQVRMRKVYTTEHKGHTCVQKRSPF